MCQELPALTSGGGGALQRRPPSTHRRAPFPTLSQTGGDGSSNKRVIPDASLPTSLCQFTLPLGTLMNDARGETDPRKQKKTPRFHGETGPGRAGHTGASARWGRGVALCSGPPGTSPTSQRSGVRRWACRGAGVNRSCCCFFSKERKKMMNKVESACSDFCQKKNKK